MDSHLSHEDIKRVFADMTASSVMVRRQMERSMARSHRFRYLGMEELCLFSGQLRAANIMDTPLPPMKQGNCYGNAFRLMLDNPSYTYVEGIATMRCASLYIPTPHGWVEDEMGMIHDPTWKDCILEQTPKDKQTPETLRKVGEAVYCGIRVPRRVAMISALFHDTVNIVLFDELINPFMLRFGTEHFEHLLEGHVGPLDWGGSGDMAPLSAHKKMGLLRRLSVLPDEELENRCRELIESTPCWVRKEDGTGYVRSDGSAEWAA